MKAKSRGDRICPGTATQRPRRLMFRYINTHNVISQIYIPKMAGSPVFDFFAQVNEHLTGTPKRKSRLESYFQAHLEFQGRYVEPSPTPEPSIASAVNSSRRRSLDGSAGPDNEYPHVEYSMPKKRRLSAYAVMRNRLAAGVTSPSLSRQFSAGLSVPSTPGSGNGSGKKRKHDVYGTSEAKGNAKRKQ